MKLTVVTPRYGDDIAGGAETAAREYATRLAARGGIEVSVLTTTALDAQSWANEIPAGSTSVDGVDVHRFAVAGGRAPDFDSWSADVLARPAAASDALAREWIRRQGPVAPELIAALADSDADVIAFHPYLYHPTVAGIGEVASRSVLHGAAHDEPPLRLPVFDSVYAASASLAFWTEAERALVRRRFRVGATRQAVLGLGVEPMPGDPEAARRELRADGPMLLCLGRVNPAKGSELLARLFAAYKQRRPGPLRLVFAGPVDVEPDPHPDIVVAGRVSDEVKWGVLRAADALVSPSPLESFGIVLMEAWSVGTPVMVNARCAVTSEHVAASSGGVAFGSYAEFEVQLDRILASAELRERLGTAGAHHVATRYRWADLVDRYVALLRATAERAA